MPHLNIQELRIELATALVRIGAADDEAVLFEWHPCVDTPACRAAADPKAPCACSGIPYLSDKAWAELAPIFQQVLNERDGLAARVRELEEAEDDRREYEIEMREREP